MDQAQKIADVTATGKRQHLDDSRHTHGAGDPARHHFLHQGQGAPVLLAIAVADTHHGHQHGLFREYLPDINTAQQGERQSVHEVARRRFQMRATMDKDGAVRGQPIAERAQSELLQAIGNNDQAVASLRAEGFLDMGDEGFDSIVEHSGAPFCLLLDFRVSA